MFRLQIALTAGLLALGTGCAYFPQIIITHDPLTADEHIQLGVAYEEKKEWDYAIDQYTLAVKKDPSSMAHFYLGNAYCGKEEYSLGIQSYLRAARLFPHNGDIYNNLAWAYLKENRIEEGSQAIQKALALEPDNSDYLDTQRTIDDARRKVSPSDGDP